MSMRRLLAWVFDQSLRTRLVVLDLTLFAGIASFLLLWLPAWMDQDARTWMERKAAAQVELLAVALAPGLEFGDTSFLGQMLALLHTQADACSARVLDGEERAFVTWGEPSRCAGAELLRVSRPIVAEGGTRGTLEIDFSLGDFEEHRQSSWIVAGLVSLGVLMVGGLLSFLVGGILVIPLERLTEASLMVARGQMRLEDFRGQAGGGVGSRDEASKLAHALTLLTGQIGEQIRQLEQERERAVYAEEQALASSKAKSAFLATMSHELRTPLNAIIGYAEMLVEEIEMSGSEPDAIARQVADLKRIQGSGQHLLSLIDDVLDLSKIEAGRFDLVSERFSFRTFAQEIEQHVIPLAMRNNNTLRFLGIDSVGELVNDRVRLKQCLLNLLSNACKFTQGGQVELRATREEGNMLRIEVSDTGIGIPPQHLGRLFREFEQADASTTRRFGGTGLGLALTRRICRLMGGDVTVASEAGRGSTFTIRVPLVREEKPARPTPANVSQASAA
jgi:signal transduction histidine kinase